MDKYYNGACANQVMRQNGKSGDVSGVDAAEECNRLDKRITELERESIEWANNTGKELLKKDKRIKELEAERDEIYQDCIDETVRANEAEAQLDALQQQVCDECDPDDYGWKYNAVEGRHPCTCIVESGAYQELKQQLDAVRPYLQHHPECDFLLPTLSPAVKRRTCTCGLISVIRSLLNLALKKLDHVP